MVHVRKNTVLLLKVNRSVFATHNHRMSLLMGCASQQRNSVLLLYPVSPSEGPCMILGYYFVFVEQKYTLIVSNIHHVVYERTQQTTCISGIHTISVLFVLNIFYSQLHMKGIEQHTMPMQSLSFLHVHGIHSIKSIQVLYQ